MVGAARVFKLLTSDYKPNTNDMASQPDTHLECQKVKTLTLDSCLKT